MEKQAKPEKTVDLTAQQTRAARALLAWSQHDLAKSAGVAVSTVADFEREHRNPVPNNIEAMKGALERAGVTFLPGGAVIGPAPAPLENLEQGLPIRWVEAADLSQWAERLDGQGALPTLLSKLIHASSRRPTSQRFSSEEGIYFPGWDGVTESEEATTYLPEGTTGWEIGTQRNAIARKATEDYEKRTRQTGDITPATSTFVFVTPRHWPKKSEWVAQRKAEGRWRDVRAYDVDDLVHWIELYPEVGNWLAVAIGKRPSGVRSIEEVWDEWSSATQWRLTEELVLADRDENAAAVLRWLRAEPSLLTLQGETTAEVASFFYAAVKQLPNATARHYLARCLVATTSESARTIEVSRTRLIIILMDAEPGIAQRIVRRGHHVLLAYGDGPIAFGETTTLSRPSREGIEYALVTSGIVSERAKALSRDSARSLAVLRRLIPAAPGRLPVWAEGNPPRALLAAVLAGAWDEQRDADKEVMSRLSGAPYDELIASLVPYTVALDSPIRKVGATWKVASPRDAWFLLAHHYSTADVRNFSDVAQEVLGAEDPRYHVKPDERWMASIKGITPTYSEYLRHGIGETLILLALFGQRLAAVPNARSYADLIVRSLLDHASRERWWSLSRDFRLLAEASPQEFLDAIDASLTDPDPAIGSLFGGEGGVFGREHLSDLLWALESLAWSPDYISRVSLLLAKLDERDPGGRFLNRPGNSLRSLLLLWNPQTYAKQADRFRVLDVLRKRSPKTAWKVMLGILPSGHDSLTPSPQARWRDFSPEKRENVTYGLMHEGALQISQALLDDVGHDVARWEELLDRIGDVAPGPDAVLARLREVVPKISNGTARTELWQKIRAVLHHHRQFPDAEWSLSEEVLSQLHEIYEALSPDDMPSRIGWLFDLSAKLPKPIGGWEAEEKNIEQERQKVARALFKKEGEEGIFQLAHTLNAAGFLGATLAQISIPAAARDAIVARALRGQHPQDRNLAHGLIFTTFRQDREPWVEKLISRATEESWGIEALQTILGALPSARWTWEQAKKAGVEVEKIYWEKTAPVWIQGERDDIIFAANALDKAGRARHAIHFVGHHLKLGMPSSLIVALLQNALIQPWNEDRGNEPTMFQHHVTKLLKALDEADDVEESTMLRLEWDYLPLLEHSNRPPRILVKAMSERPAFFLEVLSAVYRPSEESGVKEEPRDPELVRAVASKAYNLLRMFSRIPGTEGDGTIDGDVLEKWTKEARSLAAVAGRGEIVDQKIGELLSASPDGGDGIWPAEPVRNVIELISSHELETGFIVGVHNRRGVTVRSMGEGGKQEREQVAKYRGFAQRMAIEWPRTSATLTKIADDFEASARHHDDDAERLDWR